MITEAWYNLYFFDKLYRTEVKVLSDMKQNSLLRDLAKTITIAC